MNWLENSLFPYFYSGVFHLSKESLLEEFVRRGFKKVYIYSPVFDKGDIGSSSLIMEVELLSKNDIALEFAGDDVLPACKCRVTLNENGKLCNIKELDTENIDFRSTDFLYDEETEQITSVRIKRKGSELLKKYLFNESYILVGIETYRDGCFESYENVYFMEDNLVGLSRMDQGIPDSLDSTFYIYNKKGQVVREKNISLFGKDHITEYDFSFEYNYRGDMIKVDTGNLIYNFDCTINETENFVEELFTVERESKYRNVNTIEYHLVKWLK